MPFTVFSAEIPYPLMWAKVDGRQNRLRDVVGVSVILGTAILAESSSLIGWA